MNILNYGANEELEFPSNSLILEESFDPKEMPSQGEDKSIASEIKKYGAHRTKSVQYEPTKSVDMLESRNPNPPSKGSKQIYLNNEKRSKNPSEYVSERQAPKVEPK
jgi:hypothetical protein